MTPTMHKTAVVLLLVVGVQLWLLIGRGQYGSSPPLHVMIPLLTAASLPLVYRRVARWLDSVRHPSPRARMMTASAVFIAATSFLILTGFYQNRDLFPRIHDEHMHWLQTRMLSHGRLWMPQHAAADSFESFYIFTQPLYASCYFPGTALLYVPAVWLHLPYWLTPAVVAGVAAAMFYRTTAELLDGVCGLLAVLLLLSMSEFRLLALMVMSHVVMLMLGLTLIWAWLRWRATPRLAWAAVIGALGGWAAITRPGDAVCWSVPIAIAMLWTMRPWPARRSASTIAIIVLAAAPFLAVQAVFNLGVTGRLFHTPYQAYCDLYTPQSTLGFRRFDPTSRPASTSPQLIAYNEQFIRPAAARHRVDSIWHAWTRYRLPLIASTALPSQWLLVLLPAGVMAATAPRWVLLGVLPLWLAMYAMFAFLLAHYLTLATPMIIFAALLGQEAHRAAFPRLRDWITTIAALLIIVLSLHGMPQFNRLIKDDVLDMQVMQFDHRLPAMVRQPALVLYRFNPSGDPHDEPVYNTDVAWPDNAPIIRAHDRSPRQNRQLFEYYAQRQPDRQVYLVDRARVTEPRYEPRYLGRVADLAGPLPMSTSTRTIIALLLLIVGVQLWLVLGRGDWGYLPGPLVWAAILLVSFVPPINRRVAVVLDRIARPSPRARLVVATAIALAAGVYLYFTAVRQNRDFFLKIHDEHSYAMQARMLAAGRLWMPAHPAADSFDSPYVLVRPVYASMYFPGTALTLVPAVWLGTPWWMTPLLLSAASVGVLYRVVAEMLDGVAGLLAALMLVGLGTFRELSLRLYSQTPMLFLALCLTWAWLGWRRDRRVWRAALMGVIAGWMLIVRPLDALVFLTLLAIAIASDLRKPDPRTILTIAIGAAPFLALQMIANRGITGSWTTTPHAFYAKRDFPGVTLGFHAPRAPSSLATIVPQKRVLYADAIPAIERHRPRNVVRELLHRRVPGTVSTTLPNNLLVIFLPLGVAALLFRRAPAGSWVLVAPLPLFLLAYAFYLYYSPHYLIVIAPAMIVLTLLGARDIAALFPRAKHALTVLITCSVAGLSLVALPEFHRTVHDDVGADDLPAINDMLANLTHRPAIVLFRYAAGVSIQREPVYNVDTKDIDDAGVIRAHDLPGEANRRLLEYYAARQPQRHVYRVIRKPDPAPPELIDLGPVTDVSRAAP